VQWNILSLEESDEFGAITRNAWKDAFREGGRSLFDGEDQTLHSVRMGLFIPRSRVGPMRIAHIFESQLGMVLLQPLGMAFLDWSIVYFRVSVMAQ